MPPIPSQAPYSSAVVSVLHGDDAERAKALEHIIAAHWKVLYKYLRLRYDVYPSDAGTLVRLFLDRVQEKGFFDQFDANGLPVRFFLRDHLDSFVAAQKDTTSVSSSLPLDFAFAEEEYQSEQRDPSQSPQQYFESEWVRSLFTLAIEELLNELQSEGKTVHFFLFLRYDLQNRGEAAQVSLEDLAKEMSISVDIARNFLAEARTRYQAIVKGLVQSFTSSEDELQKEVRLLFGDAAKTG